MYIGNKEIKEVEDLGNGLGNGVSKVVFTEGEPSEINTELLAKIQSEKKGDGGVTDSVIHYFATTFLAQLSYYGLDYYFAKNVGMAMDILAHNLREQKIAEKFGVSSTDSIKLKQLFDEDTNSPAA